MPFGLRSVALASSPAAAGREGAGDVPVRIVLVGDSTVTDKSGWGKAFADRLAPGVFCTNMARGGESSKSCIDQGRWTNALAARPTVVLIQFGHNDMPGKGPKRETDPGTTYRANLVRFIDEVRAAGARPILVTSIPRRNFKDGRLVGELAPYVEVVRAVGTEKKVPVADLFKRSIEVIERMGPEASEKLGPVGDDGRGDHTHLSQAGKELTAGLLADEVRRVAPDLAPLFRKGKDP